MRAKKGLQNGYHCIKKGFTNEHWDIMYKTLKRGQQAFDAYSPMDVIHHVYKAKILIGYHTMTNSNCNKQKEESFRFNGIGFGVNVLLHCHTDVDFTLSIVQVHIDNCKYGIDNRIVSYFCFPKTGIAVPLHPGDYLLFNPKEPHCLSSSCCPNNLVHAISCYLKTSVVGLNDNAIPYFS